VPPQGQTHAPAQKDQSVNARTVADSWARVPETFRISSAPLPPEWENIFGPLRRGTTNELVTVGQIGQSLDGRIATPTGHSHYINGAAGLAHLHRLRALVDAVVVGIGTAASDDPQLTVRLVTGPNPARVVIDPGGKLRRDAKVLAADGVRRLVITTAEANSALPAGVEVVALRKTEGQIEPAAILEALAERGLSRVLIEGGADTVSRFLAAGCLDRLHVVVAPIVLGSGRTGITLPPIERADEALRVPMRIHHLDDEVLFDCDLSAQRRPVGRANMST
jgi:diaminohydroxyphosphoribosylaminopyrimidine deaminase/5-amino-6-(5-phosphoribosylamino)uracil reductase